MSEHQKFTLEQLKGGESVLSKQTAGAITSQKGMTGIGMPRPNLTKDKHLGIMPLDDRGLAILRNQTGKSALVSQSGMLALGSARPQAFKIVMKSEWKTKEAKIAARKSDGLMPKQAGDFHFATQSSVGVAIGARRNQCTNVRSRMKKDLRCEGAAPFQSGTNKLASQKLMTAPPGTGAYRKQTSSIDYKMDEEKMRAATQVTPWFNGLNKFASQKLTGGFSKSRDVCPHVKDFDKPFNSNDKLMECHGVLSAQRGTNKLASQHGMTGQSMIGGVRNQVNRAHWKQEWLDQLEEAEREWKISHPRYGEPEAKPTEIIIPKKEKTPAPAEEEEVAAEEEEEEEEE